MAEERNNAGKYGAWGAMAGVAVASAAAIVTGLPFLGHIFTAGSLSSLSFLVPFGLLGAAGAGAGVGIERLTRSPPPNSYEKTLNVPFEAAKNAKSLERDHLFGETTLIGAGVLGGAALIEHETNKRDLELQKERDSSALKLAKQRALIDAGVIMPDEPQKKTGWKGLIPSFHKEEKPKPIYLNKPAVAATPVAAAATVEEKKKEPEKTVTSEAPTPSPSTAGTVAAPASSGKSSEVNITINNAQPQMQMQGNTLASEAEAYLQNLPPEQLAAAAERVQAARLAREFGNFLQNHSPEMAGVSSGLSQQAQTELQSMVNKANQLLGDKSEQPQTKDMNGTVTFRTVNPENPHEMTFGRANIAQVNERSILMELNQLKLQLEAKAQPEKAPALH